MLNKIKKAVTNLEFILLAIISLLTYFPFLSGQMNNADAFLFGVFHHSDAYGAENNLGRFFLRFFDFWRDGMILPTLITALSICFLLLSVIILWEIFDPISVIDRLIIGVLVVCTPSAANLFTYGYTADGYCFGFLLAVIAAALLIRGSEIKSLILAGMCLVLSLGLYQAYLAVTITVCGFWLLLKVIGNEEEGRFLWKKTLRFLIGGGGGLVCYLGLFTLLDRLHYLTKDHSKGSDHLWGNFAGHFLTGLQQIYKVFKEYYLDNTIVYNSWHGKKYIHIILLLLTIAAIGIVVWQKKTYRKPVRLLCTVFLIAMIPIMLEIVILMAPGTSVYAETGLLMLCTMNLIYILPILLLAYIKAGGIKLGIRVSTTYIALFMCIFIGVFARMLQAESNKFQMLSYGMEMRLESLEDYQSGMKVLVVGRPQSGNYPFVDDTYKTITKGMISDYSLTFGRADQVANSWIELFKYYCGVNYECVTESEREQILNSPELQEMENYPAESCVKRIGDIAVIRLSE